MIKLNYLHLIAMHETIYCVQIKLFMLDSNSGNDLTVCKQIIKLNYLLDPNTWKH